MLNRFALQCNFREHWRLNCLLFFVLLLTLRLGFWQLARAEEKKGRIEQQQVNQMKSPLMLTDLQDAPSAYQLLQIRGHFIKMLLLLDNQYRDHAFGYDVVQPFALEDGRFVLINRGWVPGSLDRKLLPDIKTPSGIIELTASVYYPAKNPLILGSIFDKKKSDVAVLEIIDTRVIGQYLHKKVLPFTLRLRQNDAYGYNCEWSVVSLSPERHQAYAFQWFGIALLMGVLFVINSVKKKK